MPVTPHREAGWRTEPPVSEPTASAQNPAATAAAAPPLLPPGTRDVSHGLRVGKNADRSVELPMPNSSMFVRPSTIAPRSIRRCTTVAV